MQQRADRTEPSGARGSNKCCALCLSNGHRAGCCRSLHTDISARSALCSTIPYFGIFHFIDAISCEL